MNWSPSWFLLPCFSYCHFGRKIDGFSLIRPFITKEIKGIGFDEEWSSISYNKHDLIITSTLTLLKSFWETITWPGSWLPSLPPSTPSTPRGFKPPILPQTSHPIHIWPLLPTRITFNVRISPSIVKCSHPLSLCKRLFSKCYRFNPKFHRHRRLFLTPTAVRIVFVIAVGLEFSAPLAFDYSWKCFIFSRNDFKTSH